jgi:hypothetical protein
MIVQASSTGNDLSGNQFDIATPGGGVGQFNGCWKEWNGIATGDQFGGFTVRSQCATLPPNLQAGCYWRFDWYQQSEPSPTVDFYETPCPQQLIDRSNCYRSGS